MPRSDAASRVFKYRGAREFRDTGPRVKRGVTKCGGFPTCGEAAVSYARGGARRGFAF